jgi:hypothetical protein
MYGSGITKATIKMQITELPASFFDSCKQLVVVILPDSVDAISIGAFTDCAALEEISFSGQIKHVSASAFTNCIKLKTFILGTEDTEIGAGTYYGCESLTNVVIPEGVKTIGASAFANCVYLTSVTLPSTLEYIDVGAFAACQKLSSIVIPDSVRAIGNNAFYNCTKLSNADIGDGVVYVGTNVFAGTSWLKTQAKEDFVVVGDGVLLQYNGNAKHIVIPDTVKRIPDYRFASLTVEPESFTIPTTVEYISVDAFTKAVEKSGSVYYERRYVTIIARKGTYAEQFAAHEYYTFEAIK